MPKVDLEGALFNQSEVLALVPDLSAKSLQNWNDLRLVAPQNPAPGRHGRRLYNGVGVVCLAFMATVAGQGIRPGIARELSGVVWNRTLQFHEKYPTQEIDGRIRWLIAGSDPQLYSRGYIFRYEGRHVLYVDDDKASFERIRTLLPRVYITVELDYLILVMLDRIYAHLSGVDVTKSMAHADSPEGWELIEEKLKFSAPDGAVRKQTRQKRPISRRRRTRKRRSRV